MRSKACITPSASPPRSRAITTNPQPWPWIFLFLTIFFLAAIRLRLLEVPLERDEGEYAYAGQLLLEGVPPYQLAANMKLPGTYGMYALIMAVFGQTPAGIHLGLIVANSITIVLMFLLGRRLFGPWNGLVVGAGYGLLSLNPGVLGLAAHANHFVVLFAVAGILQLLRADALKDRRKYFGSGVLFGLAFLMKQHGMLFGVFGCFWLLWREGNAPERSWRHAAKRLFIFLSGGLFPLVLTAGLLWEAGVFDRFWFWTVTYARDYATAEPLSHAWPNFLNEFRGVFQFNYVLWPLAGAGLMLMLLEKKTRTHAVFIGVWLACSALAFSAGFYFRQQYYILLLPGLALLLGAAASAGKEGLAKMKSPLWAVLVPGGIGAAMAGDVWAQRTLYFQLTPPEASRAMYSINPFIETALIADYLKKNSPPDATVAVLGSEPQICFLAHRRSVTRYIYTYALMENHPHALAMQKEMIQEIEAAPPDFLVMVGMPFSWVPRPTSEKLIFRWFDEFWPKNYETVGLIDFISEEEPTIHWGQAAAGLSPQSGNYLYIFRRKNAGGSP